MFPSTPTAVFAVVVHPTQCIQIRAASCPANDLNHETRRAGRRGSFLRAAAIEANFPGVSREHPASIYTVQGISPKPANHPKTFFALG